jgi:hypothetical protein
MLLLALLTAGGALCSAPVAHSNHFSLPSRRTGKHAVDARGALLQHRMHHEGRAEEELAVGGREGRVGRKLPGEGACSV